MSAPAAGQGHIRSRILSEAGRLFLLSERVATANIVSTATPESVRGETYPYETRAVPVVVDVVPSVFSPGLDRHCRTHQ